MVSAKVTTRQFEIFLTMVLSRNMAEAANELGVSVAAVSKNLKTLERETGLKLFRIVNGRLVPTPEAERLLPFAQRATEHLERACQVAQELRGGEIGKITIGTACPTLVSLLPSAIEHFNKRWPEIRIEIQVDNTRKLLDKVASNEVDLGVGTPLVRDIDPRTLQLCAVRDLCETLLVAVLPKTHPLTRSSVIRPKDLESHILIGLPAHSATTHLISAAFQQAGVAYTPPIVTANAIGVCSLVHRGVGIGLTNPLVLRHDIFPNVVARPFRPRILLRTCLYYSKMHDLSPPVAQFIESLTTTLK